jgi:hypothetical protein
VYKRIYRLVPAETLSKAASGKKCVGMDWAPTGILIKIQVQFGDDTILPNEVISVS